MCAVWQYMEHKLSLARGASGPRGLHLVKFEGCRGMLNDVLKTFDGYGDAALSVL